MLLFVFLVVLVMLDDRLTERARVPDLFLFSFPPPPPQQKTRKSRVVAVKTRAEYVSNKCSGLPKHRLFCGRRTNVYVVYPILGVYRRGATQFNHHCPCGVRVDRRYSCAQQQMETYLLRVAADHPMVVWRIPWKQSALQEHAVTSGAGFMTCLEEVITEMLKILYAKKRLG